MQSNSSEFLAEALTQLRKENTDPLTILLVSQAQARLEHKQEIERLDRDLDQHKKVHAQQLQKFQEELYSGQKLLESVRQDIDAIHNNKDTFNVYDLRLWLDESWTDYQSVGRELRRIRIDLGLPQLPKSRNVIPGTPPDRQPREHHKAVGVEFCKKYGYPVPKPLQ
jgi:predicted component of type VI protein secretion system|tara:strand:- start:78 stop:578 length:501 start_codon:yes stop_codon:yes gene_type:complete